MQIFTMLFFCIGMAIGMPILCKIHLWSKDDDYAPPLGVIWIGGGSIVFFLSVLLATIIGGIAGE